MITSARPATLEAVRFGEFLRDRSLITDEQWLAALAGHWSWAAHGSSKRRGRIGSYIVEAGFLPAEVVEREAAAFHDDLDVIEIVDVPPRSERVTVPVPLMKFTSRL